MASRTDAGDFWSLAGHDLEVISLKSQTQKVNRLLLFLFITLTLFGVLMVYEASVVSAFRDFADKYFYLRQQGLWALFGLISLFFFAILDYHRLKVIAFPAVLLSIAALILVLISSFGVSALGARRWLSVGPISIHPAEFAKLALVIYFSLLFSKKKPVTNFLIVLGAVSFLIMLEPDLGTTVVIAATSLSIYFVSGTSLFGPLLVSFFFLLAGTFLIFLSPYRRERLLTFLNLTRDPLGTSYHIRQVLLALGSGGLWGLGLGASRQKYQYLPEAMTDSIFAIIGEELGFLGAAVLVLAFLVIIFQGMRVASRAPDSFGQLLAVGITSLIGIQAFINLSSMVALVPLTGVPLPFISYGGSSLIITLTGAGILLNISKQAVLKK